MPLHRRHHLPRLPPRIPGRSRYEDRHPRGQASARCGLEGGGPPYDLPGPAQGLQCLGQVQVTGYPGGLWHEAQGPSPPTAVLGKAEDGGASGRILRSNLPQRQRGYPGRPTVAQNFQCGGGHSGLPLGIPAGGGTGGTRGERNQRRGRRKGTDGGEEDTGTRRREKMGGGGTLMADGKDDIFLCR